MKKFAALIVMIGILSGCVSSATTVPLPQMPQLSTTAGKECARQCQGRHADSNQSCSLMVGGARTALQRAECLDNSNTILSDCYQTCE
jgi:hypothetical protein